MHSVYPGSARCDPVVHIPNRGCTNILIDHTFLHPLIHPDTEAEPSYEHCQAGEIDP